MSSMFKVEKIKNSSLEHVLTANHKKIMRTLIIIVIVLSLAGLARQYSTYFLGDGYLHGFVPLFNLDREMNIPTWFFSFMMLFSALLLWAIAIKTGKGKNSFYHYWISLSGIFIFSH
ncbi:MAG: hypothetical protein WCC06_10940 [Candidatus Aminicenantales bacterium]